MVTIVWGLIINVDICSSIIYENKRWEKGSESILLRFFNNMQYYVKVNCDTLVINMVNLRTATKK